MIEIHHINSKIFYIKYCLLAFTVLFSLTGLSLVIIGTTINEVFSELSYFLENEYFAPAVFLYSVGLAVFAIALVGLIGALKENSTIITTYGILLGIVCLLEIGAGLSTNIVMQGTIIDQVRGRITTIMTGYSSDKQYQVHVDALQEGLLCCGITGPSDWSLLNGVKPPSCCRNLDSFGSCGSFYQRGCLPVLYVIINDVASILSASAYVLALMQLAGMCFALYLAKALRAQKIAKECRRWALTNQLFSNSEEENFPGFQFKSNDKVKLTS